MDKNEIINWSIFFSWQSDLDRENDNSSKSIKVALRNACNDIESNSHNIKLTIDDATRDESGSIDIAETIFQKISTADIFICDLTTINEKENGRKVPNPNVSIELGYAIALLGRERIISLFNKTHGNFPDDIPFDFKTKRILDFKITDQKDSNGKGILKIKLGEAIKLIIDKKPPKPYKNLNPEEEKKNRDIENLKWALNQIYIPLIDNLAVDPYFVNQEIEYFWIDFNDVMSSSRFHLYDQNAAKRINKFFKHWQNLMSSLYDHYECNVLSGTVFSNTFNFKSSSNNEDEKVLKFIKKEKKCLDRAFKALLDYIRAEYIEINTDETSDYALAKYQNSRR